MKKLTDATPDQWNKYISILDKDYEERLAKGKAFDKDMGESRKKLDASHKVRCEQIDKRNDAIDKKWKEYMELPWYKKMFSEEPTIWMKEHHPFSPSFYIGLSSPFFVTRKKPRMEEFLTYLSEGKLD